VRSSTPNKCIERKPTSQSVLFLGKYINISVISLYTNISKSYLSYIFSGQRYPSIRVAKLIALALDMNLSYFINGLDAIHKHAAPHLTRYRENLSKQKRLAKAKISVDKVSPGV
jgi:transcriptional regulator with XRE-family HTH domain